MTRRRLGAALSIVVLLAVLPAAALGYAPQPLTTLERGSKSDVVIVGTAVAARVEVHAGGRPYTHIQLVDVQTLKGPDVGPVLELQVLGGPVNGGGVFLPGTPQFRQGRRYVLFLRNNGGALLPVVGGLAGVLQEHEVGASGRRYLANAAGRVVRGVGTDVSLGPEIFPRIPEANPTIFVDDSVPERHQSDAAIAERLTEEDTADAPTVLRQLEALLRSSGGREGR